MNFQVIFGLFISIYTISAARSAVDFETCQQMKTLNQVLPKPRAHWVGDGFNVFPVFANLAFTNDISPFLMFDHAAPKEFKPTNKKLGVGQHPHRGFETVTIAYQGEVEHGDSVGNRGVIGPGDCQWMTAASGIIHEEFHSRAFAKTGGTFEMAQLWVNLPAKHKMTPPRYQPLLNSEVPRVPLPGGKGEVKLYAGEYNGTTGSASTFTPINLWDVSLLPTEEGEAGVEIAIPADHNTLLFVRQGRVQVQDEEMVSAQVAHFNMDGDFISVKNLGSTPADLLIMSGVPLNEPIANRGPFVMNTQQEIMQANMDFQSGKMGGRF